MVPLRLLASGVRVQGAHPPLAGRWASRPASCALGPTERRGAGRVQQAGGCETEVGKRSRGRAPGGVARPCRTSPPFGPATPRLSRDRFVHPWARVLARVTGAMSLLGRLVVVSRRVTCLSPKTQGVLRNIAALRFREASGPRGLEGHRRGGPPDLGRLRTEASVQVGRLRPEEGSRLGQGVLLGVQGAGDGEAELGSLRAPRFPPLCWWVLPARGQWIHHLRAFLLGRLLPAEPSGWVGRPH